MNLIKKEKKFDIVKKCINIEKNEMLFEQYRMTIKREKYYIEVRDDDAIKRNQILFDLMQQTFNRLYGLYLRERFILIDMIMKY